MAAEDIRMTGGFGTHNFWAAFRGWLWARICFRKNISWSAKGHPTQYTYHVVKWDAR